MLVMVLSMDPRSTSKYMMPFIDHISAVQSNLISNYQSDLICSIEQTMPKEKTLRLSLMFHKKDLLLLNTQESSKYLRLMSGMKKTLSGMKNNHERAVDDL